MTLWIVLTAMISVAATLVVAPFLRRQMGGAGTNEQSIALARSQIEAIDAEVAQGLLAPQEAQSARREIERRIVAATRAPQSALGEASDKVRLVSVAVVSGWVVIGSAALYLSIGRPDLPAAPHMPMASLAQPIAPASAPATAPLASPAQAEMSQPAGSVDGAIASLAARLRETPEDAEGWRMLGWSYFNTGRHAEAADAYARAVALVDDDPDLWSHYGETLVRAADGLVTTPATEAFDAALALNADDARARFFKGMALEQDDDPHAALDLWIGMLADARADADWAPGVLQRVRELANQHGIDIAGRLPETEPLLPPAPVAPGPTQADVDQAAQMTPADRQAMIAGMVDGLEARLNDDPDDPDGWMRLMQSRMVLDGPEAGRAAYERALRQFSQSPDTRARIDAKATEMGLRAD
ncbi:cytochrome c-type biogenesis protein CcmH [Limimaricola variabilis]|uniref:Cytochrome c-type biogenesis protein CcmH n=1 Tax=Limimaricola variabilis TaxID=1492771 RepID=A0ABR6HIR5_9RHOB|nr:c-type cytochrome biogenesis protein CcmI [Limimaricola variabilis]MBB3710461.1 cytochrome c-type biogenesis protein CcmH [Limimaricola variabilis]